MSAARASRSLAPARGVLLDAQGRPPGHAAAIAEFARAGEQLVQHWLPRLVWSAGRTGRAGLVGLALIAASAVFYLSTERPVTEEIGQLRSDLAAARAHPAAAVKAQADALRTPESLPLRTEIPKLLALLLAQADAAQLTLDSAKYEVGTVKAGPLVRYQISFPVDGTYPQVRAFIDSTLGAIPALSIDELSITRKTIADPGIEAQIRMTLFTRSAP